MRLFFLPLALLSLAAIPAFAQVNRYSFSTGDVSLVSSGTTLTIQQPAANGKLIALESATVYCSVACSVTQVQNGAAATATAGVAKAILPLASPALANIFTASNVGGGGTAAGGILRLSGGAGTDRTLTLASIVLVPGGGTGTNYSIVVSSITGTANITLIWNER